MRLNRRALTDLGRTGPVLPPELVARIERDVLGRPLCVEFARGSWGIRITGLKADENEGGAVSGRWSLVRTPLGEPLAAPTHAVDSELVWSRDRDARPTEPVLFDFDADGLPEALVVVEIKETNEAGLSHERREGRLWTFTASRIEPYPAARDIVVESTTDVDGDGRRDLLSRGPYAGSVTQECGLGDAYPVMGPLLVAHSTADGGFTWSDDAARRFARHECPRSPSPVLVLEPGSSRVDLAASARNVACARLWGRNASELDAEIRKACARAVGNCPACDDSELLVKWATLPAPVELP